MIVILIIGILAGFFIARNQGAIDMANSTKVKAFAAGIPVSLSGNYLAQWKFTEGSGQTTADSWGANGVTLGSVPGVDANDPIWVSSGCVSDYCLSFGGSHYAYVTNNFTINPAEGYTVEGWVNYDVLTGDRGVIKRYPTNDGAWFLFAFRNAANAANMVYCFVAYTNTTSATAALQFGVSLQTGRLYHLVLTVASNGVSKFYVNGVLGNSGTPTNFLKLGGSTATNDTQLIIGGTYWYLDGLIDDLRIYDAALSISQIQQNYYAGANKMLAKGGITIDEYQNNIASLNNNLAEK